MSRPGNDNISEYDEDDIDFDESETEEDQAVDNPFEVEESVTRNSSAQSLHSISPVRI